MRRLLLVLATVGCGSSSEPAPVPAPVTVGSTVPPSPAAPPRRTMVNVGLFGGTSMDNLILDPTFDDGGPGIGRWIARASDGSSTGFAQRVTADAPQGASLPVGVFEETRAYTLLAQVTGGAGPYVARLWVTTDAGGGELALSLIKVSLANAGASGLASTDIPVAPEATRVLGGRTWSLFTGEAKGPFPLGAFLIVRVKGSKQRFLLQAPEVIPRALLGGAGGPGAVGALALRKVAEPRPLDADEATAIEHARRVPLVYAPSVKKGQGPP